MASLEEYKEIVRDLILEHAKYPLSHGEIENEAIIVPEEGHYELMHIGWDNGRRVHGTVIHIDIVGDKIWVQYDGTAPGVAVELVEAGVPRESIVLGFRPPHIRPHTGFAVS